MTYRPRIRIREDGPYDVEGTLPVVRTGRVRTAQREPVGWEPDRKLPAGSGRSLCRCGRSSTKPFCDGSCEDGFDGTETADRGSIKDRRHTYVGDGVVLMDDRTICSKAGFCTNRITDVWQLIGETADPRARDRLITMVRACPSGALAYAHEESQEQIEPALPVSVAVVRDGPLWVRGGVRITGSDGRDYEVRNRATLCRCGASSNKPFCDGTHKKIGFRDG